MAFSNIAAKIVTDKIMGKESKYENTFNATRMKPVKNRWEVKNMVKESVESLAINKFKIEPHSIDEIENDNGAIIEIDGDNVGIYKDKEGKIRIFKDFGNVCSVFSIDDVYPFAFLGVEYMPVFSTQKKDERIEWLYKNVEKKDYSKYSIKELNNAILNDRVTLAIRNFKKNMDYGK